MQFWSAPYKKNSDILERVSQRAVKMNKKMEHFCYEANSTRTVQSGTEKTQEDLIYVYKNLFEENDDERLSQWCLVIGLEIMGTNQNT